MSRLSIGQKGHRVLRFLLGMRTPGVVQAARAVRLHRGAPARRRRTLGAVTRIRLKPASQGATPSMVAELDAFENRWFQVARATFEHNYPLIAAQFFSNLPQATGIQCVLTVREFLARLADLTRADGPYGAQRPEARALLAARGLTDQAVAAIQPLIDQLSTYIQTAPAQDADERHAAEDALWAWYREWSTIARAAIQDRRMLRALGFRRNRAGAAEDIDDLDANDPPALPAGAAPTQAPAPALPPASSSAAGEASAVTTAAA